MLNNNVSKISLFFLTYMFLQIGEWIRTYLNTVLFNQTIHEHPLKMLQSTVQSPRKTQVNPDTAPIQGTVFMQKCHKFAITLLSFFQWKRSKWNLLRSHYEPDNVLEALNVYLSGKKWDCCVFCVMPGVVCHTLLGNLNVSTPSLSLSFRALLFFSNL